MDDVGPKLYKCFMFSGMYVPHGLHLHEARPKAGIMLAYVHN